MSCESALERIWGGRDAMALFTSRGPVAEVFRFGLVPIACRARNEDRSQVALSLNNNEVNIYGRAASEWKLQETLQGHDLRVTGIDWAPSTNRIVTCGAVSLLCI
ncbi:Actin-related protein 2/3 complex subunit 1A-like 3, partial [Homarus americanus]